MFNNRTTFALDIMSVIKKMIQMKAVYAVLVLLLVVACGGGPTTEDGVHYGNKITTDGAIDVTMLVEKINTGEGAKDLDLGDGQVVKAVSAKIEGKVEEICKKAGCWMTMNANGEQVRVVTNHEFFVDEAVIGKTVVVEGDAYFKMLSVAELQHFAEDDGQSPEEIAKITEPKPEYHFVANGLIIKE